MGVQKRGGVTKVAAECTHVSATGRGVVTGLGWAFWDPEQPEQCGNGISELLLARKQAVK